MIFFNQGMFRLSLTRNCRWNCSLTSTHYNAEIDSVTFNHVLVSWKRRKWEPLSYWSVLRTKKEVKYRSFFQLILRRAKHVKVRLHSVLHNIEQRWHQADWISNFGLVTISCIIHTVAVKFPNCRDIKGPFRFKYAHALYYTWAHCFYGCCHRDDRETEWVSFRDPRFSLAAPTEAINAKMSW